MPTSVVLVRHADPSSPMTTDVVRKFRGSRAIRHSEAAGYVVTSGTFDKAAYEEAERDRRVHLLDGERLCRYIRYIRGSRFDESTGITVRIPPDLFAEARPFRDRIGGRQPIVLAVANNKGGVGKTTTTQQLALGLAALGRRVVVVDLDPQANLTEAFLSEAFTAAKSSAVAPPHLAQYFAGQSALAQLTRFTARTNIGLVPAHPDMSLLDTGGAGRPDVEARFAHDLIATFGGVSQGTESAADWILLDTPPAISLFTRAALAVADYVITPARSRPSSLSGIRNMLRTLDTMGELTGNRAQLLGCLITHWGEDQQSVDTYTRLEELFENRHSHILANYIPFDVTIEKTHGQTHHRAIHAYERVVEEVLSHVEHS